MAMKFWGVEVKPGASVQCNPGEGKYIHLSQASLGESNGKEKVAIYLKVDDNKLVIGSLSVDTCAQIQYDLVFEKEFELSHSSKNATIGFCGYRTSPPGEESDEDDSENEDEVIALDTSGNRDQVEPSNGKAKAAKSASSADKQAKPAKVDNSDVKDEDSDEDNDSDDVEDMVAALSDSDEEDDSSDDEEEDVTPKKSAPLKRPIESTSKTPAPEKKAKIVTPAGAKTGGEGKKNVREATPHPAKKTAAKTPANSDKSKQQTPKSGGSVPCKSCTRTFNSESALQSHTKAKHA